MDDKSYTVRVPKRWARIAMIVGVTALIVAPLTAVATHSFTDVPDDNTFHEEIEWLKQSGVTIGCNPPDNTLFCPDDNVTREQMAAFMERLAGYMGAIDGTPAQADNAATADLAMSVPAGSIGSDELADGAVGAAQLGTLTRRTNAVSVAAGAVGNTTVQCEPGEVAISGGASTAGVGLDAGWTLRTSSPDANATEWRVSAENDTGAAGNLVASVLCLG